LYFRTNRKKKSWASAVSFKPCRVAETSPRAQPCLPRAHVRCMDSDGPGTSAGGAVGTPISNNPASATAAQACILSLLVHETTAWPHLIFQVKSFQTNQRVRRHTPWRTAGSARSWAPCSPCRNATTNKLPQAIPASSQRKTLFVCRTPALPKRAFPAGFFSMQRRAGERDPPPSPTPSFAAPTTTYIDRHASGGG